MTVMYRIWSLLGIIASVTAASSDDPYDLSFLTKGAAIGDSYAAGIGAGNLLNWGCSRYDGSYASLVAWQLAGGSSTLDFTYTACSGAIISGVNDQANALSAGQQFIIISAGGNDADLVGILNSCVYSFWGGLSHPNCDKKLGESQVTIQSNKFASDLDALINNAKSKLAGDGNIYYVGYAKFFDTTDNGCDSVSWHIWLNLFTREYLLQSRRQAMNNLVDLMNGALRDAVSRAGPQVHFTDYDDYVGLTNGRYCQPGHDESSGHSANRQDLFFYEMKSEDTAWLAHDDSEHDELKRRGNTINDDGDIQPVNDTLNALYGSLMQEAIEQDLDMAALQDDNVNNDLDAEVFDEEHGLRVRRYVPTPEDKFAPYKSHSFRVRGLNDTLNATNPANNTNLGTTMFLGNTMSFGNDSKLLVSNSTVFANSFSVGTVVANSTHALLANGNIVEKLSVRKLIVSDKTSRVFHPTQNGHALIANMILYQMTAQNALSLGINSFPPARLASTGEDWPQIGGLACKTGSSDTWANRDAMISAVNSFCADPHNLKGSIGATTSGTFNPNSLDYMSISISWDENANVGQHSCEAWLDVVTDSCDIPISGGDNLKHGGTIPYQSQVVNATLNIEPLVVRKIWNGGQAGNAQCNDISTDNYLDQPTLQGNIDDFCTKSAAQPGGIADSASTFSLTYNDGTPDRVVLTTEWPQGPRNYQIFQDECSYYLGVLNNDCSLPDSNNVMNWKHGGSMSDNNEIKYTITPTRNRPSPPDSPQGACNADWHWWGYSWDVWGGGFANSDFGDSSEGLLKQIRGCGAVTGWTFTYYDTPQAGGIEWHASGTLPLFISSHCLARAVESAGGFHSNC